MTLSTIRDIMEIVASAYSSLPDAMDRAVAEKIMEYLVKNGWTSPEDVAYLVTAAGGQIRITEELLGSSAPLLQWSRDPSNGDIVLRTRITPDVTKAKVNPDAEVRNVDSGAINITTSTTDNHS